MLSEDVSDQRERKPSSRGSAGPEPRGRGYRPTAAQLALRRLIRDKTRILAYGGSRSGKTFEFCRALATLALRYGGRYAVFRRYFNAAKNAVFNDTFPKVLETCYPGLTYRRNASECVVVFPHNGAEIWFVGLDDDKRVEKILGREYAAVYFNECSEIAFPSIEIALTRLAQKRFDANGKRLRNRAFFDCNPPGKSHWSYRLFVEGVHPISRKPLPNVDEYGAIQINPADNLENLPDGYVESTLGAASERTRKRFLLGEFSDDVENALWKSATIDPFRVSAAPGDLERIVVGVDPAVTSTERSDETGIVVAGRRRERDGRDAFYVLDDRSLIGSPNAWAREVVAAFERWNADVVVAETNQGGDLVVEALRNVAPNLPVKSVRATRGKILRAEPIAILYEQGRGRHVGTFETLEEQMLSFVGDTSEGSPDRLDALVWALTELSTGGGEIGGGTLEWQ